MYFSKCPRCDEKSYEKLKTHSYCVCCNYSPDLDDYVSLRPDDLSIPQWATDAIESGKSNKKISIEIKDNNQADKNKSNIKKVAA